MQALLLCHSWHACGPALCVSKESCLFFQSFFVLAWANKVDLPLAAYFNSHSQNEHQTTPSLFNFLIYFLRKSPSPSVSLSQCHKNFFWSRIYHINAGAVVIFNYINTGFSWVWHDCRKIVERTTILERKKNLLAGWLGIKLLRELQNPVKSQVSIFKYWSHKKIIDIQIVNEWS